MSLFDHVMKLVYGKIPKIEKGDEVTVYSVDGCMAEILEPIYKGVVVKLTRVKCHGTGEKDGKIPAIEILVNEVSKYHYENKIGDIKTELVCNLRKMENGSKVICK